MFKAAKSSPFRRIALVGPSGSGKSYSAAALAPGKVALIHLERTSQEGADTWQAADLPGVLKALDAAAVAGYPTVVLDCLSSLYFGPTGLMSLVDAQGSRGWAALDGELAKLYAAIHAFPGQVIATFRAEEIRLVVEKDGVQRVVSQCGKVAFKADFGANFDVILEMSGGVADCKKGPPSCYGRLFPFPGAELAGLIFPPSSISQASRPAIEGSAPLTAPQEAAPETQPHPSLADGTPTPSSEPRPNGGSDEDVSDLPHTPDIELVRSSAYAALDRGASQAEVTKVLYAHNGAFVKGKGLANMPAQYRWPCIQALSELRGGA